MNKAITTALALSCALSLGAQELKPTANEVREAVAGCARYASEVLLDESGKSRCDYNMVEGKWYPYEEPWHTGQIILGLVEAYQTFGEQKWLDAAVRAGNWWMGLEIKDNPRFKGMVGATHGDFVGNDDIVFATVSDGSHGLFELTKATGDRKYATLATSAITWLYENTYYPEKGVCYDLINLKTGEVKKEDSPFHQGKDKQDLFDVSRPNTEGSPFKDAYEFGGDERLKAAHIRLCDALCEYQEEHGLWMLFTPNHKDAGSFHPRFNLWNAESLLECYDMTGDRKYLEAAAKTARTYAAAQKSDGTMFYDNYINGRPADKGSVCGSEVAFAGILWLRLVGYGYTEFQKNVDLSAYWLVHNRYAENHPDPNLRGGVINTRLRFKKNKVWLTQRDVGTSFALRFLSEYYMTIQ